MIDQEVLKESSRLVMIKWKYAMETGCEWFKLFDWCKNHKELYRLLGTCGWCNSFACPSCPLFIKCGGDCAYSKNWYKKWRTAKTKKTRIKYATLIYKLAESIYEGRGDV